MMYVPRIKFRDGSDKMQHKNMKFMRNFIVIVVIVTVVYTQRTLISDWWKAQQKPTLPVAVEYKQLEKKFVDVKAAGEKKQVTQIKEVTEESKKTEVVAVAPAELPSEKIVEKTEVVVTNSEAISTSINLAIPFTPQAPDGNWKPPFKEACEETSVYMVHAFFSGVKEGAITSEMAENEIQKIVAFENNLFGYYEDTTAEQTATFAELMFGYQTELIQNPTVEQIKAQLNLGRPVIVPAAGRLLGNPYYTAPGPIYHMLVIRGYTADGKFITNDPGTRQGKAYLYDFETFMNAIHDWNGGEEITQGKKVVLVLYPS